MSRFVQTMPIPEPLGAWIGLYQFPKGKTSLYRFIVVYGKPYKRIDKGRLIAAWPSKFPNTMLAADILRKSTGLLLYGFMAQVRKIDADGIHPRLIDASTLDVEMPLSASDVISAIRNLFYEVDVVVPADVQMEIEMEQEDEDE